MNTRLRLSQKMLRRALSTGDYGPCPQCRKKACSVARFEKPHYYVECRRCGHSVSSLTALGAFREWSRFLKTDPRKDLRVKRPDNPRWHGPFEWTCCDEQDIEVRASEGQDPKRRVGNAKVIVRCRSCGSWEMDFCLIDIWRKAQGQLLRSSTPRGK